MIFDFRLTSADLGDDSYVVSADGELDVHTAPRLDDELSDLIARGARRLVIDLSGAAFIDSTTLGVLLRALKRLESRRGVLLLVADDPRVLRTFEITGLNRRFRVERALADAIAISGAAA